MISVTRTRARLAACALAVLAIPMQAQANSDCLANFSAAYPAPKTAGQGGCQICHKADFSFNRFGADLASAAGTAGVSGNACTVNNLETIVTAVAAMDSDNEGIDNIVEIDAGAQPGWCDTRNPSCSNDGTAPTGVLLDPPNAQPVANAGGPYSGEAGSAIQFDGSASSDADADDVLSYTWDFGDQTSGTGATPTHTFAAAGTYQVTLVVYDGRFNSEAANASVTVSPPNMNVAPVANPGGPYAGAPGEALSFDGTASSDANQDPLTYHWDFGDGGTGDVATPDHAYAAEGQYTVSLTVNDGAADSAPATTTASIMVPPTNSPPVANPGGPYSGDIGVAVEFDGSASTDPDNDALTFAWSFGDGGTAAGEQVAHVYAAADTYTVTLTVSDGEFESSAAETTATISDPADGGDGAILYNANCAFCHADPWAAPAVDESLAGLRRVAGARDCNIEGSIFGTSVFPGGVVEMRFLQYLGEAEIGAIAEYLNSRETSGEQRYVTTCAGCHGNNGAGGRVDEDVHGESAGETLEAIDDESEMRYMACMPAGDIESIADFLSGFDDDADDDGIDDDHDSDDDNDGIDDEHDSDDDNDGLDDEDEREHGTDPRDYDSDDDDVSDGQEREDGTDPLDDDTDDDGLDDGEEKEHHTNPNDADTDKDGVSDGDEVKVFGTDPLSAKTRDEKSQSNGGGAFGAAFLSLLAVLSLLTTTSRRRRNARAVAGR